MNAKNASIGSMILHDGDRDALVAMIVRLDRPTQGRFAAECAERVLRFTDDPRAGAAIAAARAWADGAIRVGPARSAAIAAHAAAREATAPKAVYACRAAGHAAATAHAAGHAIGPCDYALKALAADAEDPIMAMLAERRWQKHRLEELLGSDT